MQFRNVDNSWVAGLDEVLLYPVQRQEVAHAPVCQVRVEQQARLVGRTEDLSIVRNIATCLETLWHNEVALQTV